MKLKLDDKGVAVLQDGKPVYTKDDGSEVAFDAAATLATISRLNGEAKGHRERAEKAEAALKSFDGIDGEAARKALETVKNLDNKKLIDAGEAEKVRSEVAKTYEAKLAEVTKTADQYLQALHAEKIGGSFSRSKFIAEKLAIPGDLVQAAFGKHFALKDGKIVATGADGNPIYTKDMNRVGELADFDEALEALVSTYPNRDAILKSSGSAGTDKRPGTSPVTGARISRKDFEALPPAVQMARVKEGVAIV